jgi:hypothetical protein
MIQRTALVVALTCAAVSCGAEEEGADGPPPFRGLNPDTAVAPLSPAGSQNGPANGNSNGISGSPISPGSEGNPVPSLPGSGPAGSGAGGAGATNGQGSAGTAGAVPPPSVPGMDTVIEAETFNQATSTDIDFAVGCLYVVWF